ncbi:MAG TPA: thiamine ABC transporter substrate-binding protein [Nocardioidaceae bacterium]|nr:thiamine ABC transporter substrate-binding protein [Nocardioidaceae bacterium]
MRPRGRPARPAALRLLAAAVVTLLVPLAACSVVGTGSTEDSDGSDGGTGSSGGTVVVATHDSWAMSKQVLAEFTERTGYRLRVQPGGDAGQLTNRLVLTKGSPIADLVYGIDTTFASRAVDEGVLADYTARGQARSAAAYAPRDPKQAAQLTPIDFGDVCVNVDDVWFREHRLAPPRTLDDLVDPAYRDLFVTPGANSSSPGLAFLLATIAKYDDDWPAYWGRLMANGAKVTAGWSDAYEVDFTASGGDRPIVLSYASSPPFTVPEGAERPTTSSLPATCFRQVEYAGVVAGARNPAGARAFLDFMTHRSFQAALPEQMYVFPVDRGAPLPPAWARFATVAPRPLTVPSADIAANRDDWLREWADITSG